MESGFDLEKNENVRPVKVIILDESESFYDNEEQN